MPELQTRGCRVITLVIFSPALIPTPVDLVKQPEDNIRVGFSKMAFVLQTQKCQVVYGNNANGGGVALNGGQTHPGCNIAIGHQCFNKPGG
jgi:hypothetical protein